MRAQRCASARQIDDQILVGKKGFTTIRTASASHNGPRDELGDAECGFKHRTAVIGVQDLEDEAEWFRAHSNSRSLAACPNLAPASFQILTAARSIMRGKRAIRRFPGVRSIAPKAKTRRF